MTDLLSDDELAVVRDALADDPPWLDLARRLEAKTDEVGPLRWLALGFIYLLKEHGKARGSGEPGTESPYELMFSDERGTYPPPPAEVQEPVRGVWRQAIDAIDHPILRARLHDLAYVADGRKAHKDGRAAAEALAALAALPAWTPLDRAQCIARALDISRELNDASGKEAHASTALTVARELLGQEHPGPPFIVIRALLRLKKAERPAEFDALVESTVDHFADGPHHVAAIALATDATTDPKRRQELHRQRLDVMIAEADRAQGLAQVERLRRALGFAQRVHLNDDAHDLLARLQAMPTDDLEFESFTASTEVPSDVVEATVDSYVGTGATDLAEALRQIGQAGPPGGSRDDLEATVTAIDEGNPLVRLGLQTVFAPGSAIPTFIAETDADKHRLGLGRHRTLAADFSGTVLYAPMLKRAVEHHGRPSHEDLTAIWSTEVIGPVRGERIARALELWWDGHPDDAAHILVPRLESIMRDLAQGSGAIVRKAPTPGEYKGVVSLNVVMDKLIELWDGEEWMCYLADLLCNPLSVNLRNDIAHGLVDTVGSAQTALLLQAACFLLRIQKTS